MLNIILLLVCQNIIFYYSTKGKLLKVLNTNPDLEKQFNILKTQ